VTTKQLALYIGATVALALTLAWVIERAQVRAFMTEFDMWWERKSGDRKSD
jgi:hypothetical protein